MGLGSRSQPGDPTPTTHLRWVRGAWAALRAHAYVACLHSVVHCRFVAVRRCHLTLRAPPPPFHPLLSLRAAASNIRFGPGVTSEVGMDVKNLGVSNTLLVTDPNIAKTPAVRG